MGKRPGYGLTSTFLSVEGVVYAAFLILDLTGQGGQTVSIKYAGILLCLAFALTGGDRLVPLALALTAGANWFLYRPSISCACGGRGREMDGRSAPGWRWGWGRGCTP